METLVRGFRTDTGVRVPIARSGLAGLEPPPDQVLSFDPRALRVRGDQIETDAITSRHLAASAVGSSEIATDAVGAPEIAPNAVGTSELANESVTAAKVAKEAWTAYTPTWASVSNPQPAIGNGNLNGAYLRLGNLLFIRIHMNMGSTTTFGTSSWSWTLPAGITAATLTGGGQQQLLTAYALDSGTAHYTGVARSNSASTKVDEVNTSGGAGAWQPSTPFTWAVNDELVIEGMIEVAT